MEANSPLATLGWAHKLAQHRPVPVGAVPVWGALLNGCCTGRSSVDLPARLPCTTQPPSESGHAGRPRCPAAPSPWTLLRWDHNCSSRVWRSPPLSKYWGLRTGQMEREDCNTPASITKIQSIKKSFKQWHFGGTKQLLKKKKTRKKKQVRIPVRANVLKQSVEYVWKSDSSLILSVLSSHPGWTIRPVNLFVRIRIGDPHQNQKEIHWDWNQRDAFTDHLNKACCASEH